MNEFFEVVFDPDIVFLRYALIVGLLSSISFGMIGTYVVARRISYMAGAISHSILGGVGLGLILQRNAGIDWFDPVLGAILAALVSAIVIGLISLYGKQREDTVIGAIWAIGMAMGFILISQTKGYVDLNSYLFGNILWISRKDLILVLLLDVVVVGIGFFFYHKLMAICFDEEFTSIRGIHVKLYYILLLCVTAMTIVLLVRIVGIVMVIALLTLPPAIAGHFSKRLWQMMLLSILFCAIFTVLGLAISYTYDLPSGPTIILLAGSVYLATVVVKTFRK